MSCGCGGKCCEEQLQRELEKERREKRFFRHFYKKLLYDEKGQFIVRFPGYAIPPDPEPEPPQGCTVTLASADLAIVQAAVNNASDGDVICLPAGTWIWADSLLIQNKTVSIKGFSEDSNNTTNLQWFGFQARPLITIDNTNKFGYMSVSNIFFDKAWVDGGVQNHLGFIQLFGPIGWKNVRIHHNRFRSYNRDWHIYAGDFVCGVVDHNQFIGSAAGIRTVGLGDFDWTRAVNYGTSDWFFIENNLFDFPLDFAPYGANDVENGGRVVFRYNTVNEGFFQTHDLWRSGFPSGHAYEVYNNTFNTAGDRFKAMEISSGTGVVHDNFISGNWTYGMAMFDYKTAASEVNNGNVVVLRCNGSDFHDQNTPGQTGWRCQYQCGSTNFLLNSSGANAQAAPLYFWNNSYSGNVGGGIGGGVLLGIVDDNVFSPTGAPSSTHIQSGRDYVNNGASPKPGYVAYTYPHPLQAFI